MRSLFLTFAILYSQNLQAGMLKSEVLKIQRDFIELYSKNPQRDQTKIVFLNTWDSPASNAYPRWIPEINKRFIELQGGLLLHPQLTKSSLIFLICHEFGHHFGGKPYISRYLGLSTEGQSDYYASKNCFKKFYSLYKKDLALDINIENKHLSICKNTNVKNHELCLASLSAGESFLQLQVLLSNNQIGFDIEATSPLNVPTTITGFDYPTYQCRMDTIAAGARHSEDTASSPSSKRPSCWYKKTQP